MLPHNSSNGNVRRRSSRTNNGLGWMNRPASVMLRWLLTGLSVVFTTTFVVMYCHHGMATPVNGHLSIGGGHSYMYEELEGVRGGAVENGDSAPAAAAVVPPRSLSPPSSSAGPVRRQQLRGSRKDAVAWQDWRLTNGKYVVINSNSMPPPTTPAYNTNGKGSAGDEGLGNEKGVDRRNGKPSELTNEAAANEAVLAQQAVLEIVAVPPDSGEQGEEEDSGSLERSHSGQLIRRIEGERLEEEREVYNIHVAAVASAAADAAVMMGALNTRMRRLEGVGQGLVER
ncbi:unnamed protein product [Ectocarpus sp. CCAP 1310/34]|nr:unnamed protein product [Ectocarpus sp. CCAP 1310/34]